MKDNRQTQEAATIREKSEYIRRIEDFASFMQKEYIEDCEGRSLLISAGDLSAGDPHGGMIHIILGDRNMTTAGLTSMMRQDGMGDIFRMARIVSADNDDMTHVIIKMRRDLLILYIDVAVSFLWTLCIIAFQIIGIANWITTVSNLLLMAFASIFLWNKIRQLRRKTAKLVADCREEKEKRLEHRIKTFLNELMSQSHIDDDDDE